MYVFLSFFSLTVFNNYISFMIVGIVFFDKLQAAASSLIRNILSRSCAYHVLLSLVYHQKFKNANIEQVHWLYLAVGQIWLDKYVLWRCNAITESGWEIL